MTYPTLPALHGYSIHKRPTFATSVRIPRSGREVTKFQQTLPLWEFELVYETLRDSTANIIPDPYIGSFDAFQQIAGLFTACAGEYGFFYFEDTSDKSRTEQILGVGDGVETTFRLLRTISFGLIEYNEPVGGINLDESITVFVNGISVPQIGNWEISDNLMFLVFDSPVGATDVVSISYSYFYLCRFITNEAEFEEFLYNRWSQNGLRFRSVIIHEVGAPTFDPLAPLVPPTPVPPSFLQTEITIQQASFITITFGITSALNIGDILYVLTKKIDAADITSIVLNNGIAVDWTGPRYNIGGIEIWWGRATSNWSGGFTVTLNYSALIRSQASCTIVTDADLSINPFDAGSPQSAAGNSISIDTTSAATGILVIGLNTSSGAPTNDPDFTLLATNNWFNLSSQTVSYFDAISPQSGLICQMPGATQMIYDVIKAQ